MKGATTYLFCPKVFTSLNNCVKFFKVGDFGLARWQPDGDTGVETRVIGTFGYVVH